MRKIIFMAVAGYLWKKFKANRAAAPRADLSGRSYGTARAGVGSRPTDVS